MFAEYVVGVPVNVILLIFGTEYVICLLVCSLLCIYNHLISVNFGTEYVYWSAVHV